MIRRCEPSHRPYTELCNRSGSPVLGPAHSQMYNADALEDYWEDASVSLRSRLSWEAPSSGWLDVSTPVSNPDARSAESKSLCVSGSRHVRPCRYSFDASDYLGSAKGQRCFPPPLTSCSTLSIKEGGRFVLKEMDADRPQGFFRAQRENGRLLLHLVLPDEVNDDVLTVKDNSDDEDEDFYETYDGGEDEDASSVVECTVDSSSGMFAHVDVDAHVEALGRREHSLWGFSEEEVVNRNGFDGSCGSCDGFVDKECDHTCETHCEAFHHASSLSDGLQDDRSEAGQVSLCPTREHVSKDDGCSDTTERGSHCSVDVGELIVESRHSVEQGKRLGCQQQESLWNVDAANHALASRSSWSANQMCLHPSLINMRPAVGLAMS
ncbi:hypothetical protein GOP47_0019152 [Adiantum capillus-veneris]|uniref:FAF domain-containing protein n=1 Tax=Adiantum capillus-veneris TaxID=13818 RepID=A0A9D4UFH4_ADICA|nr:hypothetical protein GOP47_0019152 [Adiantum capillus-veneris]